ncbi:MAG: hypothetical protein RL701_1032 [Pseudomonadota bacterium]|jgi:hypothetical protein
MNTEHFATLSDLELEQVAGSGVIGKVVGGVEDLAVNVATKGVKAVAGVGSWVLGAGSEVLGAGASFLGHLAGR